MHNSLKIGECEESLSLETQKLVSFLFDWNQHAANHEVYTVDLPGGGVRIT
jgi:hypothetical protein